MAKCPVIKAGGREFADGCRRIVGMSALAPDIRVQNSYRIRGALCRLKRRSEIVRHPLAHIADARDVCRFASPANKRLGIGVGAKCNDIRRKLKTAAPPIQRIMVPVNNEYGIVALAQPLHFLAKSAQSAIFPYSLSTGT